MSRSLEGFGAMGDPDKMAQVMIDSAARHPAPRRLAMGSSTYAHISEALTTRLAELDAQKPIALSTEGTVTATV